jgi:hypothetical protein
MMENGERLLKPIRQGPLAVDALLAHARLPEQFAPPHDLPSAPRALQQGRRLGPLGHHFALANWRHVDWIRAGLAATDRSLSALDLEASSASVPAGASPILTIPGGSCVSCTRPRAGKGYPPGPLWEEYQNELHTYQWRLTH